MSIRYVLEHVNLGARLARLNRVRSVFQLTNNPEKTFPLTNEFISLEYHRDLVMGRNLMQYITLKAFVISNTSDQLCQTLVLEM